MYTELWHGSVNIIEKPIYGHGNSFNDYGQGFYCTEDIELAKEWAATDIIDGYANHYIFDMPDAKLLNLSDVQYTILNWLALLVDNRKFAVSSSVGKLGKDYLKENFLIDISAYDVIKGYRADDSYFTFAKAFLNNTISLNQLSKAMKLGNLGEQIVIKSEKAFKHIHFLDYEAGNSLIYFTKKKERDTAARKSYQKQLAEEDLEGIFMRDILREKIRNDDPRLF